MKKTDRNFADVGLHDAKIVSVQRRDASLILSLDFAALIQGHPDNHLPSDHLICSVPELVFVDVTKEESRTWNDDTKQWEDHRHPLQPLDDEIMESKYEADHFFLDGFHRDGWSEWRIWAKGFELNWESEHPYHHEG